MQDIGMSYLMLHTKFICQKDCTHHSYWFQQVIKLTIKGKF